MRRLKIEEVDDIEPINKFKTINELSNFYNLKFNTIIADCEGFFDIFLLENYDYFDNINLIILEEDNSADCNYFIVNDLLEKKGLIHIKNANENNMTHSVYYRGNEILVRPDFNIDEIIKFISNMNFIDKNNNKIKDINTNELKDVVKFLNRDCIVLELGARYGVVSSAIYHIIDNKDNMVVVEPDNTVIPFLKENMKNNNIDFKIYNGIISKNSFELKMNGYGTHIIRPTINITDIDKLVDLDIYHKYKLANLNIKSKLIPIQNKYTILDTNLDFNINIFYKSDSSVIIRSRRVDDVFGWNLNDLNIRIYSIDNDTYIDINVVSNKLFNESVFELPFKIIKMNLEYESDIPKIIIQTSESTDFKSLYHLNAFYSMLEFNSEFEYRFFDDIRRRQFIKEHFPKEVLDAYDILIPGSFKADLFKYCVLYLWGGCYMDNKFLMRKSIRSIIQKHDKVISNDPTYDNALYTAIMFHKQGDIKFWDCIQTIINNIKIKLKSFSLEVSGPMVQYKHFKDLPRTLKASIINPDKTIKHRYKDNIVEYNGDVIINCFFRDYYHHSYKSYDTLFHSGFIYFDNLIDNGDHRVLTYPIDAKFNIILIENNLIIKRIDSNNGWDSDLILQIIFMNHTKLDLRIGKSNTNVKVVSIVIEKPNN